MNFGLLGAGNLIDDGSIIAKRFFDVAFIYFDLAFLLVFVGLLIWKKKYMTLIVGVVMGVVYMLVDYGLFYLAFGERVINLNGSLASPVSFFFILFWMSMSYGFTNFTWIWLWISKDKHLFEWTLLILLWWFVGPIFMQTFATGTEIVTYRTSATTHGGMVFFILFGYLGLIIWNFKQKKRVHKVNIPWLLAIGLLVQFGWEMGLLIGGIRSESRDMIDKVKTVLINSLLETNLGMPYIFFIFMGVSMKYTERLKKRTTPLTLLDRIAENNHEKVRSEEVSNYLED